MYQNVPACIGMYRYVSKCIGMTANDSGEASLEKEREAGACRMPGLAKVYK